MSAQNKRGLYQKIRAFLFKTEIIRYFITINYQVSLKITEVLMLMAILEQFFRSLIMAKLFILSSLAVIVNYIHHNFIPKVFLKTLFLVLENKNREEIYSSRS